MRRSFGRRTYGQTHNLPNTDDKFNRVREETGPHLLEAFQQPRTPEGLKGQAWIDQQKKRRPLLTTI